MTARRWARHRWRRRGCKGAAPSVLLPRLLLLRTFGADFTHMLVTHVGAVAQFTPRLVTHPYGGGDSGSRVLPLVLPCHSFFCFPPISLLSTLPHSSPFSSFLMFLFVERGRIGTVEGGVKGSALAVKWRLPRLSVLWVSGVEGTDRSFGIVFQFQGHWMFSRARRTLRAFLDEVHVYTC